MEKEALIQNLKTKVGVDNLSDRTYDEIATLFLPSFAEDEKITDESYKIPVQMLKSMSGQLRHDLSGGITEFKAKFESEQKAAMEKAKQDAIDAFKAEWEKTHPEQKVVEKTEQPNIDDKLAEFEKNLLAKLTGEESAFGKLNKQFSDYMQKTEQEKKDAFVNKVRDELKSYLMDTRMADREPVVNLAIKELTIDEKSDFDKLKIDVEKSYERLYKEFYGDAGGGPYAGGMGGSGDSNQEFDKFIKERQAKAAQEAKDAEELKKDMM